MWPQPSKEHLSVFQGPPVDVLSCIVDDLSGEDLRRTNTQSIKGRARSQHVTLFSEARSAHHFKVRKPRLRVEHDLLRFSNSNLAHFSRQSISSRVAGKAKAVARGDFHIM